MNKKQRSIKSVDLYNIANLFQPTEWTLEKLNKLVMHKTYKRAPLKQDKGYLNYNLKFMSNDDGLVPFIQNGIVNVESGDSTSVSLDDVKQLKDKLYNDNHPDFEYRENIKRNKGKDWIELSKGPEMEVDVILPFLLQTTAVDTFEDLFQSVSANITKFISESDWALICKSIVEAESRIFNTDVLFYDGMVSLNAGLLEGSDDGEKLKLRILNKEEMEHHTYVAGGVEARKDIHDEVSWKELDLVLKGKKVDTYSPFAAAFLKYLPELNKNGIRAIVFRVDNSNGKLLDIKLSKYLTKGMIIPLKASVPSSIKTRKDLKSESGAKSLKKSHGLVGLIKSIVGGKKKKEEDSSPVVFGPNNELSLEEKIHYGPAESLISLFDCYKIKPKKFRTFDHSKKSSGDGYEGCIDVDYDDDLDVRNDDLFYISCSGYVAGPSLPTASYKREDGNFPFNDTIIPAGECFVFSNSMSGGQKMCTHVRLCFYAYEPKVLHVRLQHHRVIYGPTDHMFHSCLYDPKHIFWSLSIAKDVRESWFLNNGDHPEDRKIQSRCAIHHETSWLTYLYHKFGKYGSSTVHLFDTYRSKGTYAEFERDGSNDKQKLYELTEQATNSLYSNSAVTMAKVISVMRREYKFKGDNTFFTNYKTSQDAIQSVRECLTFFQYLTVAEYRDHGMGRRKDIKFGDAGNSVYNYYLKVLPICNPGAAYKESIKLLETLKKANEIDLETDYDKYKQTMAGAFDKKQKNSFGIE